VGLSQPKRWLSQWVRDLMLPQRLGSQQGVDLAQPKRQGFQWGMDLSWWYDPFQPERQESWWSWCMDLAWTCVPVQPEGRRAWWSGAEALQVYRVGTWPPTLLLLDCGVEKPSMISGFRVPYFWLSLVFYLSQVCLQRLCGVPGSGSHEICSFVSVAIIKLTL
jgi:hypothetical protein